MRVCSCVLTAGCMHVHAESMNAAHAAAVDDDPPMMTPNSPSALPKISTTRILTNSVLFCASDRAQLLPTMPTHMPHTRLAKPQVMPEPKIAYPAAMAYLLYMPSTGSTRSIFVCRMMATMTP